MDRTLTAEDVRIAYRLMLGREPESETVVQAWQSSSSFDALRRAFLTSDEFRAQLPAAPGADLVPLESPPLDIEWQTDAASAAALLAHIKTVWTRLGKERPHWSVLSTERFLPESISQSGPEFFASGGLDNAMLVACLARHQMKPGQFPRLFEFGCGLARVTPFFARTFRHVTACDVSTSHMDVARQVVADAGSTNVTFNLAGSAEFGMTGPFDLWFSRIVLQHNPPPVIALILRRCFSLLAPGGVAAFQVPTYAVRYRFGIADYLNGMSNEDSIEMHVLPQPVILGIAAEYGCYPLEVWQDRAVGSPAVWTSSTFLFRKKVPFGMSDFSYSAQFRAGA